MSHQLVKFIVKTAQVEIRLQNYLKEQLGSLSGKTIKKLIDNYGCRVNGKVEVFSSRKIVYGDQIELDLAKQDHKSNPSITIIFENEDYYICNKGPNTPCEDDLVQDILKNRQVKLVHRLDKDTTGLLIVAKHQNAQKAFEQMFRRKEIEKNYLCITQGVSKKRLFTIENFLKRQSAYHGQSLWGSCDENEGVFAATEFSVIDISDKYTLFSCKPITGRTHQIRVHLSEAGFVILGDSHYGRTLSFTYNAPRVLLHASDLKFTDPFSLKKMQFKAPLPPDFSKAKKTLFQSCM